LSFSPSIHHFSTRAAGSFTARSPPGRHPEGMGDFLVVVGIVVFVVAMLALIKGLERI
jgi:hypothetical protein